jgi:hypothetical protein
MKFIKDDEYGYAYMAPNADEQGTALIEVDTPYPPAYVGERYRMFWTNKRGGQRLWGERLA